MSAPPTPEALGRLLPSETEYRKLRLARRDAHDCLDQLWKGGPYTRPEAYQIMADVMELPRHLAHIRYFSESECRVMIARLLARGLA